MKHRLILSALLASAILSSISNSAYAQRIDHKKKIPNYDEIKPRKGEIVDQPKGSVVIKKVDLFGYPTNSVIYILNGQKISNVNYVQNLFNRKDVKIESVTMDKSNRNGKRLIKINYKVL